MAAGRGNKAGAGHARIVRACVRACDQHRSVLGVFSVTPVNDAGSKHSCIDLLVDTICLAFLASYCSNASVFITTL